MLCTFLVTDRSVETSRLLPAPCPRGGEGVTIESGEGLGERNAWMSIRSEHYVVSEEEAEAIWFLGTLATIKATAEQTHGALSAVELTHPPGYRVPRTSTTRVDEAFYILAGEAQGICGDQSWRGGPGSFIWLPRGRPHAYSVDGDETLRSLAINLPAGFEQFVAEAGEPARERTLPPPGEPDFARLDAAAAKVGIEHLAPPPD